MHRCASLRPARVASAQRRPACEAETGQVDPRGVPSIGPSLSGHVDRSVHQVARVSRPLAGPHVRSGPPEQLTLDLAGHRRAHPTMPSRAPRRGPPPHLRTSGQTRPAYQLGSAAGLQHLPDNPAPARVPRPSQPSLGRPLGSPTPHTSSRSMIGAMSSHSFMATIWVSKYHQSCMARAALVRAPGQPWGH